MSIIKGLGKGVGSYSRAFNYMLKNNLTWFFIFPLLLNVLLFVVGYQWIIDISDSVKVNVDSYISTVEYNFINSEWLRTSVAVILQVLFRVMYFLLFMFFGGYVIIAIMSPVFSILSERTEKLITGKQYPFDMKQFMKDVLRGVFIAIRNSIFQLIAAVLLFFASFIPLVGFVTPFIMFFISAYFYGFSFLDYAIERKKLGVKDSVVYMRNNKGLVTGNGLIFALLLLVPVCGVFLSAFAAIVSVVAGTILVEDSIKGKAIVA